MKKIFKIFIIIFWTVFNLFGMYVINYCGFNCSVLNGRIPGFGEWVAVIIELLILMGVIFGINKFFEKEKYRKWWSIFFYCVLIFYPFILWQVGNSLLCGCGHDF